METATDERQKCPKCGDEVPVIVAPQPCGHAHHVLKRHGTYTIGASKPYRECKGSGSRALPPDPFEDFRS